MKPIYQFHWNRRTYFTTNVSELVDFITFYGLECNIELMKKENGDLSESMEEIPLRVLNF